MEKIFELTMVDNLSFDEIMKQGINYRIDTVIGALSVRAGQNIYAQGWENTSENERLVYVIDEICRHCYMDGIDFFLDQAEPRVKNSAIWALETIKSKRKSAIIKTALAGDVNVNFEKLTSEWCRDKEDIDLSHSKSPRLEPNRA